ncbi:uncharacterized protein LOC129725911 [Wyeomyia smithii]|uniref:uncharacterized protein LOC129725911 n=1 Tax=Wyeomyia smithii TaxID=174621 RepID=UPI002467CBC6|nr:uncharacterized protein LOC129725911 [Wyeomyia smithii]
MHWLQFRTVAVATFLLISTVTRTRAAINLPPVTGSDTGSLLRRCPCVPVNTCYSQGVNLNEQQYLNANFQCPMFTYQHCCGPYYPTLGGEGPYFQQQQQQVFTAEPSKPREGENVLVVLAQSVSPAEETLGEENVMTVLPETTENSLPETTTELPSETTTDIVEETTTPEATTTTTTTVSPPRGRLSRFHHRRPIPRYERSSTPIPSRHDTSTTEQSPIRRLPSRRGLYQRRRKEELTSSTTEAADE